MEVLYEREAGALPSQLVRAPDGRWTASVPGLAPPDVVTIEGRRVVFVDTPIGSRTPVYCQVYDEELEIAGTIHQLLGMALQDRQVDSMVPWAVTIDNGHPAAWLEVFYTVDRPGNGKAGGLLKLAISAREDHPILCFHEEVGYKESFRRVVQEFFRSFEPSQRAAEPNYLDVMIRYLDDVPIGFKKSVSIEEKELDGYQRWITHAMLMAPVGDAKLQLKDDLEIAILDTTGHVAFGRWTTVLDGKLMLDLELERVEGNLYRYAGQLRGEPRNGEFRTMDPQGLSGAPLTARTLATHLARSSGFSLEREEYVPAMDPAAPYRVIYYHHAEDSPGLVRLQIGDVEILRVVDEHGMLQEERLRLPGYRFRVHRELRQGKL
jgi:hypothetical protein